MDLVQELKNATKACTTVVEGIQGNHLANRTPCSEWDVQGLMNHLIGSMAYLTARAEGRDPGTLQPANVSDRDDAVQQLVSGMDRATSAWATPGALERKVQSPFGETSGTFMAGITLTEIVIHGWDLAKATGQRLSVDDALAEQLLASAKAAMTPETRGRAFGPEVTAPEAAPSLDRLVAYLGRQP